MIGKISVFKVTYMKFNSVTDDADYIRSQSD